MPRRLTGKAPYELLPGGKVRVPLTKGLFATIDAGDLRRVVKHSWCAQKHRERWYASANVRVAGVWKRVLMHRFILGFPDSQVDHKDNDGLNNTRSNLRPASHADNLHNAGPDRRRGKTSRFKGVSWSAAAKKWHAQIMSNRKYRDLGYFSSEEEAARVYDAAAKEEHGEFARLNFRLNPKAKAEIEDMETRAARQEP